MRTFLRCAAFPIVAGIAFGLAAADFSTAVRYSGNRGGDDIYAGANIGHLIGLSLPAFAAPSCYISEPYRLVGGPPSGPLPGPPGQRLGIQSLYSARAGFSGWGWPQQAEFLHTAAAKRLHILHHREELGFIGAVTVVFCLCLYGGDKLPCTPGLFGCMQPE